MLKKDFTLFVGLNDKDTKKQKITKSKAIQIVQSVVGDCTISEAFGCYTHGDGAVVQEKTLRVEVFGVAKSDVTLKSKNLKMLLNQESIGIKPDGAPAFFV